MNSVTRLWDIFKIARLLLELRTNDVGDRLIVGHTICAICTVREELGVEVEGHDRHDAGEREIVEIWIILLAEPAVGTVSICYQYAIKVQLSSKYLLLRHDIVVELLFRVLGSELNILCEQPGRDVMVITATVVIVFFVRGYVGLHSRMPV